MPGNDKTCHLIAMDKTTKSIRIPEGIFSPKVFALVHDKNKLRQLLYKLSKTDISRTKDGMVNYKNIPLNISFDDAVVCSSNGIFKRAYEKFYMILKKYNINF